MQLPGRLAAATLGDLLGSLHRESITGQLELFELKGLRGLGVPGRCHRIHFTRGLITALESELPVTPIGEILRREGLVAAGAIAWVLRRIQAGDPRIAGEILVAEGFAHPEYIRAGLRKQLKQRLDALFTIEDAIVTFHTARPFGGLPGKVGPLWPNDFLHGRPRSRDRARVPGKGTAGAASRASAGPSAARHSGPERGPFRVPPGSEAPPPRSRTREVLRSDERERAHRLLGLTEGAGPAEVRRAFRRLAAELHPDRHMTAPAEVRRRHADHFARLSAAYHLLVA
jgi:hypothetical protein